MKARTIAILLLVATTAVAAPPKTKTPPKAPATLAPQTLAHADAMFMASLCSQGARRVTFKALALSTRFFLEEPAGVTVYSYDGARYQKEKFLKGLTLEKAVRLYPSPKR